MPIAYTSFEPNVEVIGQNLLSFIQNVNAEHIEPVLRKYGLAVIEPEKWYPLQQWLDVLSDLAIQSGGMFDLVAIGAAISQTALMPPEVEKMPFEQFLFLVNDVYQMQHRNGKAGEVKVEKIADQHMKIVVRVPYPDDLEYGTTYGFAHRFLPKGTKILVEYDPSLKRRDQGGESTTIHVTWE
ncbi:MAG: hypothetical protein HY866_05430 [Chloroflexi bacterium]|nr:hypothetical protein [Chloroflexota bacterium]